MARYFFHFNDGQLILDADFLNAEEANKHAVETFADLIHGQAAGVPHISSTMLVTDADGMPLMTLRFSAEEYAASSS